MAARRKSKTPRHLQGTRPVAAPKQITDDDVKAAVDVISAQYWQDVRLCVENYRHSLQHGTFRDREEFEQHLDEYVDNSQRVIYTYWAKLGLLATNNADAYEEAGVTLPEGSAMYSTMMFFAYKADIEAQLGSDISFDDELERIDRRQRD